MYGLLVRLTAIERYELKDRRTLDTVVEAKEEDPRTKIMSRNYLHILAFSGGILLLDIAAHLVRPPTGFAAWDYLEPILGIASIVIIWFLYRKYLQELDRLSKQVEKSALDHLSSICFSVAFLAYMMISLSIVLLHHH